MKIHTTVSPYGNIKDDLFYWIKFYISKKLFDIKQDTGYTIDVMSVSQKLFQSTNIDVFNKEQLYITKNGFSTLNVYVNPLLNLYDYVSNEESLNQITDFNTDYRDKVFLGKIKDYKFKTKMAHFVHINGLFSFIEEFLANTKGAEKYTFDITNTIVNNKLVYPFSEKETVKKFIKEYEIIQLISMMDSFNYKGMSIAKAKLMLKIVLFAGLSGAELSNLKAKSIQIVENPHRLLRGKYLEIYVSQGICRTVYIHEQLIIKEYTQYELEYKASPVSLNNELYFYTRDGKKYTSVSIHGQFEKVIQHANIENENSVNSFLKYGYASYLFKNNVSIEIILTLFGNKQEILTLIEKIATKPTREEMRKIALEWKDF